MSSEDFTLNVTAVSLRNQKAETMGITGIKKKNMKKYRPVAGGNGTIIDLVSGAEMILTVETEAGVQFLVRVLTDIKDFFEIVRLTDKQFELIKESMPQKLSIDVRDFEGSQHYRISSSSLSEWKKSYKILK